MYPHLDHCPRCQGLQSVLHGLLAIFQSQPSPSLFDNINLFPCSTAVCHDNERRPATAFLPPNAALRKSQRASQADSIPPAATNYQRNQLADDLPGDGEQSNLELHPHSQEYNEEVGISKDSLHLAAEYQQVTSSTIRPTYDASDAQLNSAVNSEDPDVASDPKEKATEQNRVSQETKEVNTNFELSTEKRFTLLRQQRKSKKQRRAARRRELRAIEQQEEAEFETVVQQLKTLKPREGSEHNKHNPVTQESGQATARKPDGRFCETTKKYQVQPGEYRGSPNCRSRPPTKAKLVQAKVLNTRKHDLILPKNTWTYPVDPPPPPTEAEDGSEPCCSDETFFWSQDPNEFTESPPNHLDEENVIKALFGVHSAESSAPPSLQSDSTDDEDEQVPSLRPHQDDADTTVRFTGQPNTSLQAPAREPKYVKLILDIFHQPDAWRPAATLPALLGCAPHPDTHIQICGVHVPKNEMLSELPEALHQRRVSLRQRSNHSLHRLQLEVTLVWNIINDYVGLEQKHRQLEKVNTNEAAMFFQECIMDLTKPALCSFKWRLSAHLLLLQKMFIYQCHALLFDEETKAQLSLLFS